MRALLVSGCMAAIMALGACSPRGTPLRVDEHRQFNPMVQRLIDSSEELRSYRLLLAGKDKRGRPYRLAIAYRSPSQMRVDVLPMQGGYALAVLVVQGSEYTSLDMESRTARRGAVSKTTLLDLLGIEINPWDLASLLAGELPPSMRSLRGEFSVTQVRSEIIEFGTIQDRSRFSVDSQSGRILSIVLGTDSSDEVELLYPSADTIQVRLPAQREEQQFSVIRRTVNPELPDELFQIAIPPGFD